MDSMSSVSDESAVRDSETGGPAAKPTVFFDGMTNRRRSVTLGFGAKLAIIQDNLVIASWHYDDLRTVDGGQGALRLRCVSGLPLARLEVPDPAAQTEIRTRARWLDAEQGGRAHTGRIVAWSVAALGSILAIVVFGVPLVAQRMVPLIPLSFERHLGDMANNQVRALFGGACTGGEGSAAFAKLVDRLRRAAHLDMPLQTAVLASPVPNAFALPGGKIYLLNGLLQKADNADEVAGVIAHEMGHVSHRDQTRLMIQNGGASFLIGLLFGDVTGSTAVIFTTRTLFEASYSREAEENADAFAIQTMHTLGRSPKPMGDLLFRITGAQGNRMVGILASHPLTEERRALMRREDQPATGHEILSAAEWRALKAVCGSTAAK